MQLSPVWNVARVRLGGKLQMAESRVRAVRPGMVVGVCMLVAGLDGFDIQAFGVAAPRMAPALQLNPGQLGLIGSIATFGLMLGAFAGGWAADRWGRKRVLLVSVVMFGVFSIATAMATGGDSLLAARFLAGLGFGGAMPNLIAMAAEVAPPGRRALVTGAMFCGFPLGGAGVSLLARLGGANSDWRMLFIVGGVLPLVVAPLIAWGLPETRPVADPVADRGLSKALFGEGRAVPTLLLWTGSVLSLLVMYLMIYWLPILVVSKGHHPADGASASLAFNLAAVAGALVLGFAADRLGVRRTIVAAYLALGVALWGLGVASVLGAILVMSGAAGFLVIGVQYILYGLAPLLYPPQVRSAAAGASVGVGRIGSVPAPLIGGLLLQAGWSAGQVLDAMIPVALAAGTAILVLTFKAKLRD
jgi:AAHS family 3-hydroxyphenylpropionic acid transporter